MKKISSIFMTVLLLISAFTFSVSAEGEPVNYAENGMYAISTSGGSPSFLRSESDSTLYYGDDDYTILNDGVNPYYSVEKPGLGVVLTGTGAGHTILFDLGATYDDIYEITFGNVWDSVTFGYADGVDGKGNRGFAPEVAMIELSLDGINFTRVKDYEIVKENHTEDGSENGFYDFRFQFDTPATAKVLRMTLISTGYCLSLSEVQIWGYGNSIPDVEIPEDPSEEEPSEESSESTNSTEVSKESSAVTSEVEESSNASQSVNSSADDSSEDESSGSGALVVGIVVAVVVVVIVVVVLLGKGKNKSAN